MRTIHDSQLKLGQVDIATLKFDPKSRDDIPQVLKGLQHLYCNKELRKSIFKLLEENIAPNKNKSTGRPGMNLWNIFVMGVLRLDLNWDYDRLHDQVNNHLQIRQMLGHSDLLEPLYYHPQTIKDNVCLLTPELLEKINIEIVNSGHQLLKKKENEPLRGRCDSFVVETNVHYPTDITLLYDAMRKLLLVGKKISAIQNHTNWRQHAYHQKKIKNKMRSIQKKNYTSGKDLEKKKQEKRQDYQEYIERCKFSLEKVRATLCEFEASEGFYGKGEQLKKEAEQYIIHAERQILQIKQRVMEGKTIPHCEKVFSVFEPHTEWIVKGKAGVPQELGLRVCVLEDSNQFFLHHLVMQKETDKDVCLSMVKEAQRKFPSLKMCSFDKGFHSPENQKELKEYLDVVALRRKGKLSEASKAIESSEEFKKAQAKHSAVESGINALEVHGLDRCPDHGLEGFQRYVALAIVARNIQRIGAILRNQEIKREERKKRKLFKKIA